jgi:uncharacterized protein YndB with AHSA1/START domain
MERRGYLGVVVGVATTTALSGCLQGEAVLRKTSLSSTSSTTAWDVDLEAGNNMRLEVDKTDDSIGTVTGYVHRADTDEEIVATAGTSGHEKFDVPATATYTVSVEIEGATSGSVVLRDLD